MKSVIFTVLLLGSYISNSSYAQAGFYGRKTVVEFGVLGRNPFISNRYSDYGAYSGFQVYKNQNGNLVSQKDKFDFGYSAGIYFLSNRMVSFGMYGSIYKTNAPGLFGNAMTSNSDEVRIAAMEQFSYTTYSFIPLISLSGNQLIKPVGVSSEIGMGFTGAKLQQKDYLVRAESGYQDIVDSLNQSGKLYDKGAKYHAFVMMYGLKMRQPLSKRLLLYYGLRYTVHFGFKNDKNILGTNTYPYSSPYSGNYEYRTTHALRRNYINFQVGLCFTL